VLAIKDFFSPCGERARVAFRGLDDYPGGFEIRNPMPFRCCPEDRDPSSLFDAFRHSLPAGDVRGIHAVAPPPR